VIERHLLIVEDELDLAKSLLDLLTKVGKEKEGRRLVTRVASTTKAADWELQSQYWHAVSMDLQMPTEAGRATDFLHGIQMASNAAKSGGLLSKLIVYSGMANREKFSPKQLIIVAARLPKVDLYSKGLSESVSDDEESRESLTPAQWARRMMDYLFTDDKTIEQVGFEGQAPRLSAVGCWLQQAPKHLPTLLARHATVLESSWSEANSQRVDAALQLIETGTRLAVVQTAALIEHSGGKVGSLPDGTSLDACLDFLSRLLATYSTELKGWTWQSYLKPVLPALDDARKIRNVLRHTLSPGNPKQAWIELRPLLQAMMDLSAYWAQHPLWTELRYNGTVWTGERLAGNQWPRLRREVGGGINFDGTAVRGGVWQSAVRWPENGTGPTKVETFQWSQKWLTPDTNGRAWYLPMYTRTLRDQRRETVTLDIDSGNLGQRPGP
jgi:CheY-like chemotaxis protein